MPASASTLNQTIMTGPKREPTRPEVEMPAWLRTKQDRALGEVSRRVDEAGFFIREGIVTHDRGVMDTFRL